MADEIGNGSTTLIQVDADQIYESTIRSLSDAVGEPLYPGDERRMFAEAEVAVLVPLFNTINDSARQTALTYARGYVLDALGARLNVTRLAGTPATCILRFTASEERDEPIIIDKWVHVTVDGDITFATDREAIIPPGELSVDVPATCTGNGAFGNGYLSGAVATLVDLVPYIQGATNIDETHGGSDGELYDDDGDDRFRERIRIAVSALSVAGPERAYEYWAKTADAGIADVAVISETEEYEVEKPVADGKVYLGGELLMPDAGITVNGQDSGFSWVYEDWLLTITLEEELAREESVTVRLKHKLDGRVRIVPLMEDGETPSDDVIERIYQTVNDREVRPMTDIVRVDKPTRKEYSIELKYWTTPENEAAVVKMVEGEGGAIDHFVADQDSVLGRDINPDVLKTYIMQPFWGDDLQGAIRVEITQPVYTPIEAGEAAAFSGLKMVSHLLESQARWD